MLQDLIAFLVATFLLGPMQADLTSRLEEARAPAAVMGQLASCAVEATPVLITRAAEDPWWAIRTGVSAWLGNLRPEAVLAEHVPGCAPALTAARPYLAQG